MDSLPATAVPAVDACPHADLLRFTDPDPKVTGLHRPFRVGRWWCAMDGKIIAIRIADGDVGESKPPVLRHCEALWAQDPEWFPLPTEIPDIPGEGIRCDDCNGTGLIGTTEACDACDGLGECPHCGHECEECDGEGVVDTDRPGEPCTTCGGAGKRLSRSRPLRIRGQVVAWNYAALIVGLHADVAVIDLLGMRQVIAFRTADGLRGFVMPLKYDAALTAGLVDIAEVPRG